MALSESVNKLMNYIIRKLKCFEFHFQIIKSAFENSKVCFVFIKIVLNCIIRKSFSNFKFLTYDAAEVYILVSFVEVECDGDGD